MPSPRRARVYSLTASGPKHLASERETRQRFAGALATILRQA